MKYKPFAAGIFKHEMGLKPLAPAEWIEIDDQWDEQRRLKEHLLKTERDKVLQARPSAEAAAHEFIEMLAEHLGRHFPERYDFSGKTLQVRANGRKYDLASLSDHPLAVVAEWVQEDVCLMKIEDGGARLEAGLLCFPSRWKLIDKMGLDMTGIHRPVPAFNQNLEKPATRFLQHTTPDKPMWRLNWTIHASKELFAYGSDEPQRLAPGAPVLENLFLRVERQTLRRLPRSAYVVFTIRTYVTPLTEVAREAQDRNALLSCLQSLPKEVAKYRGMGELTAPLIKALSEQ
jgi:hypothetical protein